MNFLKNEIFRTEWKSFLSCLKCLRFFSKFMTSYSPNVSSQGFLTSFSDFSQPFLGNFRCSGDILKTGKTGGNPSSPLSGQRQRQEESPNYRARLSLCQEIRGKEMTEFESRNSCLLGS